MSRYPHAAQAIPEDTFRVAHAAFPKGKNPAMAIRDHLPQVFTDDDFKALYSRLGQPGYAAWRLMLVCIFQFMENLSDRQAAQAVCARIDWKYALSLPLSDPGFDFSILSEFRKRLVDGGCNSEKRGGHRRGREWDVRPGKTPWVWSASPSKHSPLPSRGELETSLEHSV